MMENILKRFLASKINTGVILGKKIGSKNKKRFWRDFLGFRVPARFPGRRWWRGGPAGGTVAGPGFPARWLTAALGWHAWVMARVPAGFAARTPREKNRPGFRKGGK
jgi:hypothetical protein